MAAQRLIAGLLCAVVGLGASMVLPSPAHLMAAEPLLQLRGRVLQQAGNLLPGVDRSQSGMGAAADLVLVAGQPSPAQLGDPFLPAQALIAPVLARGRSRPDGSFVLRLPVAAGLPARATLLLQVPGGYYLNRFDHQGRFASLQLPETLRQELLLHDDRAARF